MKPPRLLLAFGALFVAAFFMPLSDDRVSGAILEACKMVQWYARNHTLACVVPALFIAGAIVTFLSPQAVLRHLGPRARRAEAYSVASVAGTVLAVCSCSVLPMFAGIHRIGAGLGPAATFLYAGPAINVLALFLTARVLGFELGLARVVGAVSFGIVIGLLMAWIFRRSERQRVAVLAGIPVPAPARRPGWQAASLLATMLLFLVFSDWYNPGHVVVTRTDGTTIQGVVLQETAQDIRIQVEAGAPDFAVGDQLAVQKEEILSLHDRGGWVMAVFRLKWYLAGLTALLLLWLIHRWVDAAELRAWLGHTWDFARLLVPLLFGGVFVVGFLGALVPSEQVARLVGDNSLGSNLIAAVVGCLFYFATLTEIPILQALMAHGMQDGPALALLLAGPALSLPSLLVIRSVIGTTKTLVFTALVVVMATFVGLVYGTLV